MPHPRVPTLPSADAGPGRRTCEPGAWGVARVDSTAAAPGTTKPRRWAGFGHGSRLAPLMVTDGGWSRQVVARRGAVIRTVMGRASLLPHPSRHDGRPTTRGRLRTDRCRSQTW